MKRKLLLFIFSFFIVFLLLPLSFFPITNTTYAMNSNCPTFGTFGGLPGVSFTVTPASVDKNHDFVAKLTASQSVINQYINKESGVNFYIRGYMGGITRDSIENGNRLLRIIDGGIDGPKFAPQREESGKVSSFRAQENTNPGTISFYIFADSGDINLRECIINSNTPTVNFTEADPGDEPTPRCVGEDVECDPTGVGASNLCRCTDDYKCEPNDEGKNRCVSKDRPESGIKCEGPEDCFSGVCIDNRCDTSLVALACVEKPYYDGGGLYLPKVHSGKFSCTTALGTIDVDPESFSQNILKLLLGLSGGILLVLIIINGYKLMTSQGDPEKIKDAREGIIAAIAGILLIIFSLSILQLIAVDIIGIPGFR